MPWTWSYKWSERSTGLRDPNNCNTMSDQLFCRSSFDFLLNGVQFWQCELKLLLQSPSLFCTSLALLFLYCMSSMFWFLFAEICTCRNECQFKKEWRKKGRKEEGGREGGRKKGRISLCSCLVGEVWLSRSNESMLPSFSTYSKHRMNIMTTPSWFFTGMMCVVHMKSEPVDTNQQSLLT